MPNWMRGTLRVRGTWKGVRRFLINALEPLGDSMSIQINEGSVSGAGAPYHIEGTERGNVVDDFWTKMEKRNPCESCKFGTYIKGMWHCGKHLRYIKRTVDCPCTLFWDKVLGKCLITH